MSELKIDNLVQKLPKGEGKYKIRKLSAIGKIAVHHSAIRGGTAMAYARYHIDTNGWPCIGYHYVIDADGTIHKVNNLSTVSYHVGQSNRIACGVCFTGNYDEDTPPEAQLAAGAALIAELLRAMPWLQLNDIWGHTQFPGYAWKSCPGKLFPLARLIDMVEKRMKDELAGA